MPDLRTYRGEPDQPEETGLPIFEMFDAYLLERGWTIRSPENRSEEINYGDSVYICPDSHEQAAGRAGGWLDALCWQADIELQEDEARERG